MYCMKCGNRLEQGARFCDACGTAQTIREVRGDAHRVMPSQGRHQRPPIISCGEKKPMKKGMVVLLASLSVIVVVGAIWMVLQGSLGMRQDESSLVGVWVEEHRMEEERYRITFTEDGIMHSTNLGTGQPFEMQYHVVGSRVYYEQWNWDFMILDNNLLLDRDYRAVLIRVENNMSHPQGSSIAEVIIGTWVQVGIVLTFTEDGRFIVGFEEHPDPDYHPYGDDIFYEIIENDTIMLSPRMAIECMFPYRMLFVQEGDRLTLSPEEGNESWSICPLVRIR